jgi:hypothetical protein
MGVKLFNRKQTIFHRILWMSVALKVQNKQAKTVIKVEEYILNLDYFLLYYDTNIMIRFK